MFLSISDSVLGAFTKKSEATVTITTQLSLLVFLNVYPQQYSFSFFFFCISFRYWLNQYFPQYFVFYVSLSVKQLPFCHLAAYCQIDGCLLTLTVEQASLTQQYGSFSSFPSAGKKQISRLSALFSFAFSFFFF